MAAALESQKANIELELYWRCRTEPWQGWNFIRIASGITAYIHSRLPAGYARLQFHVSTQALKEFRGEVLLPKASRAEEKQESRACGKIMVSLGFLKTLQLSFVRFNPGNFQRDVECLIPMKCPEFQEGEKYVVDLIYDRTIHIKGDTIHREDTLCASVKQMEKEEEKARKNSSPKEMNSIDDTLPIEMMRRILSFLNDTTLDECYLINSRWNELVSDQELWKGIYPDIAFGRKKWAIHGDVGEEPSLPPNIQEILHKRPRLLDGKRVKDTHWLVLIPKTINKIPLTAVNFTKITGITIRRDSEALVRAHGHTAIDASYWALIAKEPFIKECAQSEVDAAYREVFQEYIGIVSGYRLPTTLEVMIGAVTECNSSGKHFFEYNEIPCIEKFNGSTVRVSYFDGQQLFLSTLSQDQDNFRIAAWRLYSR